MVSEEYVPTDASGAPVGGAGAYTNSIVGPASGLFINTFGATAPQPSGGVYGILFRDVFEGAAPLPSQVVSGTGRFGPFTPGAQAIVAHQIPEPSGWIAAAVALASAGALPRRRHRS
jgi:hypothetical protein